mmetsp:Transcript_8827/g.23751  ORF Transcript_8827/g.23751 Transcript_8827/m.23751 type:complete len:315 (+) Transcript_8827:962-1906(+)
MRWHDVAGRRSPWGWHLWGPRWRGPHGGWTHGGWHTAWWGNAIPVGREGTLGGWHQGGRASLRVASALGRPSLHGGSLLACCCHPSRNLRRCIYSCRPFAARLLRLRLVSRRGDAGAHLVWGHGWVQADQVLLLLLLLAGRHRCVRLWRDKGRPPRGGWLHWVCLCSLRSPACLHLLGFAPRQPQPRALDDQLAVQLLGRLLCCCPGGVRDEGTRLGVHLADGSNLAKRIKVVLQVSLRDISCQPTHEQCGDTGVLWRFQSRQLPYSAHHLIGYRVVDAVVPILDVLLRQLPCCGHFMAVRALGSSGASAFGKE